MWYSNSLKVMLFFSFKNENIRYPKCPISTYPAEKIALACCACLCLLRTWRRVLWTKHQTKHKQLAISVEVMGFQNSCNTAHTSSYVSKNFVIRNFPGPACICPGLSTKDPYKEEFYSHSQMPDLDSILFEKVLISDTNCSVTFLRNYSWNQLMSILHYVANFTFSVFRHQKWKKNQSFHRKFIAQL